MSGTSKSRGAVVKRPTKIKVLTITYTVDWPNEDQWFQLRLDAEAVGVTERDKALISIRADETANEDALRSTLLHEVLHACTQSMRVDGNLKDVDDGEEFFIAQVAPVLMCVLNDNPNLVAYLLNVT